jgi:hypothetical protein
MSIRAVLLVAGIFGIPVVLTFFNLWNLVAKRTLIPRILLFLTLILGIGFYWVYLDFYVTGAEWNEAVYAGEYHAPISNKYLFSFAALTAVGIASLCTIALVPAQKLSPIVASFSLAGVLLGNVLNILYPLQLAPLFFKESPPYFAGPIESLPLLFHCNILLLSMYHVRAQILTQILLMDGKIERTSSFVLKRLYSFLKKVSHWPVAAFAALLPLAVLIEIVLILFGQGADGCVKMFAMTADWTFSTQMPPPPLDYDGHYLCTVAAGGHRRLVKPLRMGKRRGMGIVVNRQLMVANAFEELLAEKAPRLHGKIRRFYDTHGYPLSRLITTPLRADAVYLLMKPLEWLFTFALYLFSTDPEERISRQYA